MCVTEACFSRTGGASQGKSTEEEGESSQAPIISVLGGVFCTLGILDGQ